VSVDSEESLSEMIANDVFRNNKRFILGGGSNILFSSDYHGLVISMDIQGIKIVDDSEDFVIVEANAGTSWHELLHIVLIIIIMVLRIWH